MGSRVILQVTDKFSGAKPSRGSVSSAVKSSSTQGSATSRPPGSSPPLPPLPSQTSTDSGYRESMLLSASAFGPAFEVPNLDGLGLGLDHDQQDGPNTTRSPRGSISRNSSDNARHLFAPSSIPPPLPSPDHEKKVGLDSVRAPVLSTTAVLNPSGPGAPRGSKSSHMTRPSSTVTLEIKSTNSREREGTIDQAATDSDLSELPSKVRQRVTELRRRSGLVGTNGKDSAQTTFTNFNKSRSASVPLLKLYPRSEIAPGERTYKPLPSLDIYVLRPTKHMATQTPDWTDEDLGFVSRRPSDTPSTGWRISLAPSRWDNTPPLTYGSFPLETITGSVSPPLPPPPPMPQSGMVSPSIYSRVSTPMQPRGSSAYLAGDSMHAWSAWPVDADGSGEKDDDYVTEAEDEDNEDPCGATTTSSSAASNDAPKTPESVQSSGDHPAIANAAYRRGSLPEVQTMKSGEFFDAKTRPVTVFNPSYVSLGSAATQAISANRAILDPPTMPLPELPTSLRQSKQPTPIIEQEEDSLESNLPAVADETTTGEPDTTTTPRASSIAARTSNSRPSSSQSQYRRARPVSTLLVPKPVIPPRSAARGSPSRTRPVSMIVGDLSHHRETTGSLTLSAPARAPAQSTTMPESGGVRRGSKGSLKGFVTRHSVSSSSSSSSTRRHSRDLDNAPAVPSIPLAHLPAQQQQQQQQQEVTSDATVASEEPLENVKLSPAVPSATAKAIPRNSSASTTTTTPPPPTTDVDLVLAALQKSRRRASMPARAAAEDWYGSADGSTQSRMAQRLLLGQDRAGKTRSLFLCQALDAQGQTQAKAEAQVAGGKVEMGGSGAGREGVESSHENLVYEDVEDAEHEDEDEEVSDDVDEELSEFSSDDDEEDDEVYEAAEVELVMPEDVKVVRV